MPDQKSKEETDKQLDEALKNTFPASDPVKAGTIETEPSRPLNRKPAEIDKSAVDQIAKQNANNNLKK